MRIQRQPSYKGFPFKSQALPNTKSELILNLSVFCTAVGQVSCNMAPGSEGKRQVQVAVIGIVMITKVAYDLALQPHLHKKRKQHSPLGGDREVMW